MALHGGTNSPKKNQDVVTGPSMAPTPDSPPNPADSLRMGPLPIRTLPQITVRRPMETPVRLTQGPLPSNSPEMKNEPLPGGKEPPLPSKGKKI